MKRDIEKIEINQEQQLWERRHLTWAEINFLKYRVLPGSKASNVNQFNQLLWDVKWDMYCPKKSEGLFPRNPWLDEC